MTGERSPNGLVLLRRSDGTWDPTALGTEWWVPDGAILLFRTNGTDGTGDPTVLGTGGWLPHLAEGWLPDLAEFLFVLVRPKINSFFRVIIFNLQKFKIYINYKHVKVFYFLLILFFSITKFQNVKKNIS